MPIYEYTCPECEQKHTKRLAVADRDNLRPCPHCEHAETARVTIHAPRVNFVGDGWASKNGRISKQMEVKNRRLKSKEEEMKRDAPGMRLAPNVEGERVESWGEAQKLAASKGLNTDSYEPMIKRAEELEKLPPSTS